MNLHDAVLMAAETIRINPDLYDFTLPGLFKFALVEKPDPCGTPGCAIGWINYCANVPAEHGLLYGNNFTHVMDMFYNDTYSESLFYDEMDMLCEDRSWMDDADACAETLLKWAEKHEEKLKSMELPL